MADGALIPWVCSEVNNSVERPKFANDIGKDWVGWMGSSLWMVVFNQIRGCVLCKQKLLLLMLEFSLLKSTSTNIRRLLVKEG